jgi:hypothetical protein
MNCLYLYDSLADERSVHKPDGPVVLVDWRLVQGREHNPLLLRPLSGQQAAHGDSNARSKSTKENGKRLII